MDVSDYRRQLEAEADAAARAEPAYKQALRNARPSGRADGRGLAISSPTDGDDLSTALGVLADSDASDVAFIAALQAMSLEVDDHPELIDTLLGYLVDAGNPTDWRLAVLNLLQEISFRMVGFPAKRPEYLATLRSIIEDPDCLWGSIAAAARWTLLCLSSRSWVRCGRVADWIRRYSRRVRARFSEDLISRCVLPGAVRLAW